MILIPSYVDNEVWQEFCAMRKAKGKSKPFTDYAAKLIVYELHCLRGRGHDPNECLKQSIKYGWSDVWPVKEKAVDPELRAALELKRTNDYLASRPKITPEDRRASVAIIAGIKSKLRRAS